MTDRARFLLVSLCYQAFTLSDGALRMLVLLHLHAQGRSPVELALLLLPYEAAGVFTNLLAGALGSRHGQKPVLVTGLVLQVVACALLCNEMVLASMPWVMATQVLSGVAKDLVKTTAKSYARTLAPTASDGALFSIIAAMTGSKNAMKGIGFFLGGALLSTVGFVGSNALVAALLSVFALLAWRALPGQQQKPKKALAASLRHDASVNWLALARLFLFGSRDAWFAVALPLFLAASLGWSGAATGAFLSAWVIGYGAVQAATPRIVRLQSTRNGAFAVVVVTALLALPLLSSAAALDAGWPAAPVVIAGLCVYGILFAICSSLHSWLVVALASGDDVVERVGFYYAANSAGRLAGLLASGFVYAAFGQGTEGFVACLYASTLAVACAAAASVPMAARVAASKLSP